jgi:hypothetical protein
MVPKNETTDQFLTRAGGLIKAVTIGLAAVALAATVSLAAAGSLDHGPDAAPMLVNISAQLYVRGPRITTFPNMSRSHRTLLRRPF